MNSPTVFKFKFGEKNNLVKSSLFYKNSPYFQPSSILRFYLYTVLYLSKALLKIFYFGLLQFIGAPQRFCLAYVDWPNFGPMTLRKGIPFPAEWHGRSQCFWRAPDCGKGFIRFVTLYALWLLSSLNTLNWRLYHKIQTIPFLLTAVFKCIDIPPSFGRHFSMGGYILAEQNSLNCIWTPLIIWAILTWKNLLSEQILSCKNSLTW